MINLKVRLKNKVFWMSFIPALLILVHHVLILFGIDWDFTELQQNLVNIIEAVFVVLTIIGVVTDPTTAGLSDSTRALTYTEPYKETYK